jgi:FAD/FMN-containing dehydrogenase
MQSLQVRECLREGDFKGLVDIRGGSGYKRNLLHNFRTQDIPGSKPVAVVEATDRLDIQAAVRCARAIGLKVCARSGGGSFTGASICSDEPSLLLDIHRLKNITYDKSTGTATAELGLTLGQALYRLDQQSGGDVTLPVGLCSGIGIGGYLLGGGMGPLDERAGLLCDRLVAVEMVTATGDLVWADRKQRPELLWAACGGGGQALGLVVSATLRVYPTAKIGTSVCVRVHFGMDKAVEAFAAWQAYEHHNSHLRFQVGESTLPGPASEDSGLAEVFGCFWNAALEGFSFENKTGITGGKVVFQGEFEHFLGAHLWFGPAGGWGNHRALDSARAALDEPQWYFARQQDNRREKTMLIGDIPLPSTGLEQMLKLCSTGAPSGGLTVCTFIPVGEAVRKRSPEESAFPWRMAKYSLEFTVEAAEPSSRRARAQQIYDSLLPYKLGTYVNYPDVDLQEYGKDYWGANYANLQLLKARYDSEVVFDSPQKIWPAAGAWGQCGGGNWEGPTRCIDGYTCQTSNEWYSECVPSRSSAFLAPRP